MASFFLYTILLVMVGANAIQASGYNKNNDPFQGFPFTGSQFSFPKITFPTMQMPTFQPFSQFPKIKPIRPMFPKIKMLNPEDIINRKPKPGEVVNAVIASSKNEYKVDENGKVVKTGGSTVIINENGKRRMYTVGDAPDVFKKGNVIPSQQEDIKLGDSDTFISAYTSSAVSSVNGESNYIGFSQTVRNNNDEIEEHTLGLEKNDV
ncbi:unnamed protein product [Parnassius apollo]|uniref:(apollo) hypothetical protein n=1 Tax=Parnassius apollo TaxID=110799 RepID=A0A8S3WT27_PARAO|nr:unnamed protein product [Parnassius apollo]